MLAESSSDERAQGDHPRSSPRSTRDPRNERGGTGMGVMDTSYNSERLHRTAIV